MNSEDKTANDKKYMILVVDDEKEVLSSLRILLERSEYFKSEVTTAINAEMCLKELERKEFDLVLSDYKMPKMDGVTLLSIVRKKYPKTLRMLITAYSDVDVAKDAINRAGVHNYIEKPWDNDYVRSTIYESLKRKTERVSGKPIAPDDVEEAMAALKKLQKSVSTASGDPNTICPKTTFEFTSHLDFNRFSFEVLKFDDLRIDDVHMFENRYFITVSVCPGLYRGWKKAEWGSHEKSMQAN